MVELNFFDKEVCNPICSDPSLPTALLYLSAQIQACFNQPRLSMEMMRQVSEILQKFGRIGVDNLIRDLLRQKSLLTKIAACSYLQGNGFYKLVLLDEQDFRVRLHIWMPGIFSQENLHNHRWHFASTIITGQLRSEIWEDSASPSLPIYDEYLYVGKEKNPLLIGKASVELIEQITHQAGSVYVLPPCVLHRIITGGNEMTVTLMCRSFSPRQWSRNIALNATMPYVNPTYMQSEELYSLLERYLVLSST